MRQRIGRTTFGAITLLTIALALSACGPRIDFDVYVERANARDGRLEVLTRPFADPNILEARARLLMEQLADALSEVQSEARADRIALGAELSDARGDHREVADLLHASLRSDEACYGAMRDAAVGFLALLDEVDAFDNRITARGWLSPQDEETTARLERESEAVLADIESGENVCALASASSEAYNAAIDEAGVDVVDLIKPDWVDWID